MRLLPLLSLLLLPLPLAAQSFFFSLDGRDRTARRLSAADVYTPERGFGYDFITQAAPAPDGAAQRACFLSVDVPDGNYLVTVTLGAQKRAGSTLLRAESRRLMMEETPTRRGERKEVRFVVNKRNTIIYARAADGSPTPADRVRIKPREQTKLNWDDKLTLEINGSAPAVSSVRIEPADTAVTTLWLCGNSTVVDQDFEPWASWGQMLPRWFDERVAVANYAESGETASSFIAAGRLKKILSLARRGDILFVEFGHNDQKQRTPGSGAFYNFSTCLKQFVDEARLRGVTPVFVTPTQRRSFDADGRIEETHGDYPEAMRAVARREQVGVIELHDMTRTFFEALGPEASKRAFVHYAANTYPGQAAPLSYNTHFNPYGAYEIAKIVVEGMKQLRLPVVDQLRPDYVSFDAAYPDDVRSVRWKDSPFFESLKPDGN